MNWFDEYVEDSLAGNESVPPTVSATFPTGTYDVAKDGAVLIPVVDVTSRVAMIAVAVRFSSMATAETVYIGGGAASGFMPGYGRSSIAGTGAAGDGYTLTIRRDTSWPRGANAIFTVRAVDGKGNVLL